MTAIESLETVSPARVRPIFSVRTPPRILFALILSQYADFIGKGFPPQYSMMRARAFVLSGINNTVENQKVIDTIYQIFKSSDTMLEFEQKHDGVNSIVRVWYKDPTDAAPHVQSIPVNLLRDCDLI